MFFLFKRMVHTTTDTPHTSRMRVTFIQLCLFVFTIYSFLSTLRTMGSMDMLKYGLMMLGGFAALTIIDILPKDEKAELAEQALLVFRLSQERSRRIALAEAQRQEQLAEAQRQEQLTMLLQRGENARNARGITT